jgi:hypothetical protein
VFDVIVYHLPCADGLVACTIARNLNYNDSAQLVPYDHANADNKPPLDSFRDQTQLNLQSVSTAAGTRMRLVLEQQYFQKSSNIKNAQ